MEDGRCIQGVVSPLWFEASFDHIHSSLKHDVCFVLSRSSKVNSTVTRVSPEGSKLGLVREDRWCQQGESPSVCTGDLLQIRPSNPGSVALP